MRTGRSLEVEVSAATCPSKGRATYVRRILPAGCGQCDPKDTTIMAVGWPKSTRGT